MALNIKHESQDAFEQLTDPLIIEGIKQIVSAYHYRNGKSHNDGSRGEIKMSPKELRDLLAFMSGTSDVETIEEELKNAENTTGVNYVRGA